MKSQGFIHKTYHVLLGLTLVLAACQRLNPAPPVQVLSETPSLAGTGGPLVIVRNQESDSSKVVIEKVISNGPGWVAIHTITDGKVSPDTIGNQHVDKGETDRVVVNIQPDKATDELMAMLHVDAGEQGVYEFPGGPDVPVDGESSVVQPIFQVTYISASPVASGPVVTPTLEVEDQNVVNGIVKISRVVSDTDAWVVVHDNHGGKIGDAIGRKSVGPGETRDVEVQIDPTHNMTSPELYVILYKDADPKGDFEIPSEANPNAPDEPVKINGQVVEKPIQRLDMAAVGGSTPASEYGGSASTTEQSGETMSHVEGTPALPQTLMPGSICVAPITPKEGVTPVIQISDQEIQDGTIHIDNVVSVGPGWVVIWNQPDNGASEAIGSALVQDGANSNVSVPVDAAKATPQMLAVLNLDSGQPGVFEPDKDCVAHVGVQMVQAPFTNTGAAQAQATEPVKPALTVVVDDQPLRGGDTLIIAEVVSDGPGWVGIHLSEPDGSVSHTAAIGAGQLQDGLNTNVVVKLNNPARATEKLWGMLHYDRDPLGEYDFPNAPGNDEPVVVNGEGVVDDFLVTGGKDGQKVVLNITSGAGTSFLVDGQGFSLYTPIFGDCTDNQCLKEWRPLVATGGLAPGEGVKGQNVSVRGLGDGTRQITYAGLPLYYYVGDAKPGETNGHLQEDGRWVLAKP